MLNAHFRGRGWALALALAFLLLGAAGYLVASSSHSPRHAEPSNAAADCVEGQSAREPQIAGAHERGSAVSQPAGLARCSIHVLGEAGSGPEPVPNATVELRASGEGMNPFAEAQAATVTDEAGAAELMATSATFDLRVTAPGYLGAVLPVKLPAEAVGASRPFNLRVGIFALATLDVAVVDAHGDAVGGAEVNIEQGLTPLVTRATLDRSDIDPGRFQRRTDANGQIRVRGLTPSRPLQVMAMHPTAGKALTKSLQLDPGETRAVTVELVPATHITVRLPTTAFPLPAGSRTTGTCWRVAGGSDVFQMERFVDADEAGTVHFSDVLPGQKFVAIMVKHASEAWLYFVRGEAMRGETNDMGTADNGPVSVRVSVDADPGQDAPAWARVNFSVTPLGKNASNFVFSTLLPVGRETLIRGFPKSGFLVHAWPLRKDLKTHEAYSTSHQSIPAEPTLSRSVFVHLRALDVAERPTLYVECEPPPGAAPPHEAEGIAYTVLYDDMRHYICLNAGEASSRSSRLRFSAPQLQLDSGSVLVVAPGYFALKSFSVPADAHEVHVNVSREEWQRGLHVEGRVRAADGETAPNAKVWITARRGPTSECTPYTIAHIDADGDGRYSVNLPAIPGLQLVGVNAAGGIGDPSPIAGSAGRIEIDVRVP